MHGPLNVKSLRMIFHKIMQAESTRCTKIVGMKKFGTLNMANQTQKIS